MTNPESFIPEQHTGLAKEVRHHVDAASTREADVIFARAKDRLQSVNDWLATAEGSSAKFLLCDSDGRALSRKAKQGDLVRVDLPGPHRSSGSGYDWVVIDRLMEGVDEDGSPWALLTTRPTADPLAKHDNEDTAHFFSRESTGTFVLRQRDKRVEGAHFGRNELPNTDGAMLDKARAVLVTAGAYLGLSDVQWSNLVKGLLAFRIFQYSIRQFNSSCSYGYCLYSNR